MNKRVIAVLSAGTFSVLSFFERNLCVCRRGGNVTIEFMYYADDTQKEIIESACAAYEESHPGITIEQTVVPADGSITTTIATLASSNEPA